MTQDEYIKALHDAEVSELVASLEKTVRHIERITCAHEETYRGGILWEICRDCGAKWADDEGGKPEFHWPRCVESAREILSAPPPEPVRAVMSRMCSRCKGECGRTVDEYHGDRTIDVHWVECEHCGGTGEEPAQPIPTGWTFESFNDGRIRLVSPDLRYVDLIRGVSDNEFDPINTLYDFIVECGLTRPPAPGG